MRRMLATGLVWPSKWVERAVRANRMHRKSSWRMSKINFGILDVGIWITQKMVCYSTWKSSKWGVCSLRGSFDPPNGPDKPWWPTVCIDNVLTDVHEQIWHFWRRNLDHPKKDVLLHMKIVEMRGMLASGLVWPSKCVVQSVMANHMHRQGLQRRPQRYLAFLTTKYGSPKKWFSIAHENRRNEAYARFGARLTLQMGRTSRDGQPYA